MGKYLTVQCSRFRFTSAPLYALTEKKKKKKKKKTKKKKKNKKTIVQA